MKRFYSLHYKYIFLAIACASGLVWPLPAQAATRYESGVATNASLLRMNDQRLEERLTDIKSLGATWIRVDFSWPVIQPDGPEKFSWDMYDRLVRESDKHKLKILAMLTYTPLWAQEPRCAELIKPKAVAQRCSPQHMQDFANFARASAIRYKGTNVRAWEIWNEPNLNAFWKTPQSNNTVGTDPERYAEIANAAAQEIRHHYLDSVIITGGLAPMFEPSQRLGMRQSDYIASILPRLKPELFDGIAIHPYTWPIMPTVNQVYNAFYTVDNGKPEYNLRTVMQNAGWGDKEIWATEFGASTKGLRNALHTRPKDRPDHVTEAMQAEIIKQGLEHWYKKENVGPLFVHSDSDQWLLKRKNEGGFGLRRTDGSKKPAYDAFRQGANPQIPNLK